MRWTEMHAGMAVRSKYGGYNIDTGRWSSWRPLRIINSRPYESFVEYIGPYAFAGRRRWMPNRDILGPWLGNEPWLRKHGPCPMVLLPKEESC